VATEIDFITTEVGCSSDCAAEFLASAELESFAG
jgi:hypothetical protein